LEREEVDVGSAQEHLVDAQWLKSHLSDPGVRVVEVDVGSAAYNDWHIDGAVLWNVYADLKDPEYRPIVRDKLQRLITRSGIHASSTVVFYGYAPALGLWLLELYGHADARILDCSRDAWRAAGYPWSNIPGQSLPGTFALDEASNNFRADRVAVLDAIGRGETTLVDVRSAEEFRGERFWPSGAMDPDGRAGHVPTAVHQPIDGLYRNDGSFRSPAELLEIFEPSVLEGCDELITYCTVGGRAATAWFVLTKLIGRDRVRVYDASWAEWGRMPAASVETLLT
jgi:thiosulfate/3-mercaptopyruvate sulfurtransferase